MDRREALKLVGLLMGGAVSSSVAAGVLSGCVSRSESGTAALQTLTAAQDELVATVADLIIPATDTPGARDAGVNAFIDGMLTVVYTDAERERFLAGLADLDDRARADEGNPFVEIAPDVQVDLLKQVATDAVAARAQDSEATPFFFMMKELTLVGYYTSEIGATQELQYVHAAGRYDGDVPLAEAGRAYA